MDPLCPVLAHDKRDGAAPTESAAPDICFRKRRLEFIAFRQTPYAKANGD
jgi:hypothetical protein